VLHGKTDLLLPEILAEGHETLIPSPREAELKVTQDDGMLLQGLDYYDYVAVRVETFARLYKAHSIDPTQQVRLLLIAPVFSQTLVNSCRWLDLPISLFTFQCLRFEGETDVVPIFLEHTIAAPAKVAEVKHLDDHLNYITDSTVRARVTTMLDEAKAWRPGRISLDPINSAISVKAGGRVFAYVYPRRQHFIIGTFDRDDKWKEFCVKSEKDLAKIKPIIRAAMERRDR
jgi:hypothetical protein